VHAVQPCTQVAVLAPQLGYCSESAFGTAFKRQFGCAPRRYGMKLALKQQNGAPQAPSGQTSYQD